MTFNLVLSRINYLAYLLPLAIEGQKRNLEVKFFLERGSKRFSDPYHHINEIGIYQEKYNFKIFSLSDLRNHPGVTFLVEGNVVGLKGKEHQALIYNYVTAQHTLVSLVCNYEVFLYLDKYVRKVNYVIFPDQRYLDFYKINHPKFLSLGSPKYDSDYPLPSRQDILQKYNLPDQHYVVLMFPKNAIKHHKKNRIDPEKKDLTKIYEMLQSLGLSLIVKNRTQDQTQDPELKGDYYFEDFDNYPVNSMELIKISKLVVFFSSSLNEECIALRRPYLDFKVDYDKDRFPFFDLKEYSARVNWNDIQTHGWDKVMPLVKPVLQRLISINESSPCWNLEIPSEFIRQNLSSSKRILDCFKTLFEIPEKKKKT